jgi:GH43 family beta-xylosidase
MPAVIDDVAVLGGVPVWKTDDAQTSNFTHEATFANPLYHGADPWVTRHEDSYYLCQAGPDGRIEVWKSDTLTHRGEREVVWTPPKRGWNSAEVWAPELHCVDGRWYIYYAASDGQNHHHRMGVLESTGDARGPYIDRGQLYTGDDLPGRTDNRWAIDGTLLHLHGQLYFIWSGWEDERDIQHLYIATLSDPCTVSSNRVRLCDNNTHLWEHVGETRGQRGLNEGPQVLARHGRIFLIYSCSGSWQHTYKLGMLQLDARSNPMDPGNWRKSPRPVFESTPEVFGVGHCCFTTSPDGQEDWILFHSKRDRREGWDRVVRAQRFEWRADGSPVFGRPADTDTRLALPSGDAAYASRPVTDDEPPLPKAA